MNNLNIRAFSKHTRSRICLQHFEGYVVSLVDELTEETFGVFSEFYCLIILLTSISVFWSDFSLPPRSN